MTEIGGRDPKTGRFIAGNRFWEARSSHGRNPKFETADQLADACRQYFEWVEDNPLYEVKAFAYQGTITTANLPKMRAMTLAGLCLFIGISRETWNDWRTSRPDFSDVQREVEEIIYEQKFTGAAAELFSPNIIARDLGLAEKSEVRGDLTVKDERTPDEIADAIESKLAGIAGSAGEK